MRAGPAVFLGAAAASPAGLQFMVSTGRLHGFESLEERSLLLALDFTGAVEEVLLQPFLLRFGTRLDQAAREQAAGQSRG